MEERTDRKLPVGIQSFEKIRKGSYLYVDKTDIIWKLANKEKNYNYLSRPRRFGKSLLVDTLQAYFEGKKELFEGLKIMSLEKDWIQHPVIRLDMSRGGSTADNTPGRHQSMMVAPLYIEMYLLFLRLTTNMRGLYSSLVSPSLRKYPSFLC